VAVHESVKGDERTAGDPGMLLANRYRVIEQIGVGGMAVVYLAEDQVLMRKVAVKRLDADSPGDATRRFVREAKLGAALNHPNLVTVFDAIPAGRDVLIVMEYVDGLDLGQALERGPLRPVEALIALEDVAAAIDHAHGQGIVHRDVKPSNVLLGASGRAKLSDLGIAKALADTATTASHVVVGSVPYMSPEQLTGGRVGPPTDVHALALTAYEALSGLRAREGTPAQVRHQALQQPPPDLRELRPEIPAPAAEALKRGMAREPERRPATACELVRELSRGLGERGERARLAALVAAPAAQRTQPFEIQEPDHEDGSRTATGAASPAARTTPARASRGVPWRAILALAAIVGVAALAFVVTSGGGDDPSDKRNAATERDRGGGEAAPSGGADDTAASTGPERAVEDFYELAAAGKFEQAAAAGTESLSAQLGELDAVFDTLESIEFTSLDTTSKSGDSAQLEFATVATHTDRTERCTGTAIAIASGGAWLVDSIDGVSCEVVG
jgi:eukaryotic-like serine/threonine-protein kinase